MTLPGRLSARGVSVRFGTVQALDGVSLDAEPGALACVTGPSGAGKTTLLHVLAGVQPPTAGRVTLGGEPLRGGDWTAIALVPQTYGLAPALTALESVALPLQVAGIERTQVERRARSALEAVGLARLGGHLTGELSGGQQQRVAVARALAGESAVLVADEPTSELDADNRELVMGLLSGRAAAGAIVVVASDDPAVSAVCDTTVGLLDGRVDRSSSPEPFDHLHEVVARET
jgi:putative ABC transport system ATP-binding protein